MAHICSKQRSKKDVLLQCELIRFFGYPCEISYATTEDGYVLEMDRVRHGLNERTGGNQNKTRRYPVLFLPAFAAASDMWFLNYPSQSPGKPLRQP
ncbi:hypothetical protein HPB48_001509 [Haemaphysalis longicornis]|uniref:Partial AB-hydrolase lipase domain-containing protein n=1 Tax=Haemaphysalis longicornis TaxID=44386 RepID=A0A9J6GZ45_HAELO|nr:hypothetical protein HPB48_001509 [Haemaphysalis longicornis]